MKYRKIVFNPFVVIISSRYADLSVVSDADHFGLFDAVLVRDLDCSNVSDDLACRCTVDCSSVNLYP